jgi:hypothetical protein
MISKSTSSAVTGLLDQSVRYKSVATQILQDAGFLEKLNPTIQFQVLVGLHCLGACKYGRIDSR